MGVIFQIKFVISADYFTITLQAPLDSWDNANIVQPLIWQQFIHGVVEKNAPIKLVGNEVGQSHKTGFCIVIFK
jgi:hypothetical protein